MNTIWRFTSYNTKALPAGQSFTLVGRNGAYAVLDAQGVENAYFTAHSNRAAIDNTLRLIAKSF